MTTLQIRLRERLLAEPASDPLLGFLDHRGATRWSTRAELRYRLAARCRLLEAHGLRAGAAAVVVLPSDRASAELTLAAYLLGALPLLVAPPTIQGTNSSLSEILRSVVRRVRPALLIADASLAPEREGVARASRRTRWVEVEALEPEPALHAELPAALDLAPLAVAGLQLTSGTTRSPRICQWSHRGMLAALDGMAAAMALSERDRCLNWTPLYHDMGLVNNLLLCACRGVSLVLMSPFQFVKRPGSWLRGLTTTGATVSWSPNFGFALACRAIPEHELADIRLQRVRALYNAAERIHADTLFRFRERFRVCGLGEGALKTNFGCAENIGGATFSPPSGGFVLEHLDADALERRRHATVVDPYRCAGRSVAVVGIGRPAPGLDVDVVDRRGRALGDGEVGELALRSPSAMLGYLADARGTRRALAGGRLRTGDLGYRRGQELFWVGRARETLNVSGRKLDPSDFEPLLFTIPELRTGCMAVFGVDDDDLGTQRVVVVAEVRRPEAIDVAAVSERLRARAMGELGVQLADVVLVAPGSLAKTSSGKRRHRHFRRLYLEGGLSPL